MDESNAIAAGDHIAVQMENVQAAAPQLVAVPAAQAMPDEPNNEVIVVLDDSQVAEGSHLRESNENVPELALTPNRKKRRRFDSICSLAPLPKWQYSIDSVY